MKISAFVLGGSALRGRLNLVRGVLPVRCSSNKVLKNSRQVRIMFGLILLLGQ